MRTLDELRDRLGTYAEGPRYVYHEGVGYLAWHYTTGENVEALFLEVAEKRKGHGTALYREMCETILRDGPVPFHSVLAYRRSDNAAAEAFYRSLGWNQIDLGPSVYRGVGTTLMWTEWGALLKRLGLS